MIERLTDADEAVAFKAFIADTAKRSGCIDTRGVYVTAAVVDHTLVVICRQTTHRHTDRQTTHVLYTDHPPTQTSHTASTRQCQFSPVVLSPVMFHVLFASLYCLQCSVTHH